MDELINITTAKIGEEEVNAVNARDLHQELGVKTRFNDWMQRRIDEYGFENGVDFTVLKNEYGKNSKGQFCSKEYIISLDMAKELAMVENNTQGRKIRQYFIEVEKEFRRQASRQFPSEDVLMSTLYAEMERRIKAEAERDEYRRNLQRIALASGLDYGAISETTGLPKDIVIPTYCRSSKREHAPQSARFIQLILPLREIIHELRIESNG